MSSKINVEERIEETWKELGRKIRPRKRVVFVRTEVPKERSTKSGIICPQSTTGFYKGYAHQALIKAMVVDSGPDTCVKPGEWVAFQRLYFAMLWELEDKSLFGWIDQNQIGGYVDADEEMPLPYT